MKNVPFVMASAGHILHAYTITHLIFYSKSRIPFIVLQYVRYLSSRCIINYTLSPLHTILYFTYSRIEFTFIQVLRRQNTIQPNTNYIPFYIRIGKLSYSSNTLCYCFFPANKFFVSLPWHFVFIILRKWKKK